MLRILKFQNLYTNTISIQFINIVPSRYNIRGYSNSTSSPFQKLKNYFQDKLALKQDNQQTSKKILNFFIFPKKRTPSNLMENLNENENNNNMTNDIKLESDTTTISSNVNDINNDIIENEIDTTTTTTTTATSSTNNNNINDNDNPNKKSLIVFNLPKNTDQKKFSKILESRGVKVNKVKKVYKDGYGIVFYEDDTMKSLIFEKIHGLVLDNNRGEKLKVSERRKDKDTPKGGNKNNKRKLESITTTTIDDDDSTQDNEKKFKNQGEDQDNSINTSELKSIDDVVSPWHSKPYSEQMELKKQRLNEILTKITRLVKKESQHNLPEWLKVASIREPCCQLEGIIETEPQYINGYRNKAVFTIGLDKDSKIAIGFALGRTRDGITVVGDPSNTLIISDKAKQIRSQFELYIRSRPELKSYDKFTHQGFWRQLSVRSFSTGESMACIQVNPKDMTAEQVLQEKESIKQYFSIIPEQDRITSVSIQLYEGLSNAAPVDLPEELLLGTSEYIHEKILGLSFRVSYNAFFQVNTKTTELLYSKVLEWAQVTSNDVLLDICCGTGTIGQCMASKVKKVYGLELAPDAVRDAIENAKFNKLENVEYLVGKAENTLPSLLSRGTISKEFGCVGIVDPPRAGLHQDVIKAIRSFDSIKKLVYVSCNQDSLVQDCIRLCKGQSKTMSGKPFRPIKSIAVDLFPHTELVELVVLFERIE